VELMAVWYASTNETGWQAGKRFSIDRPSGCVMAQGLGGDRLDNWFLFRDGNRQTDRQTDKQMNKPPYRVPLMSEIAALPHSGYDAISTFSGCGGSSLGYKMAGFRVLYANEFIPAAQETYRANHKGTILDARDIRKVQPQDILDAIGKEQGELDLMDGSPPCASFSTAGKREAGWGKVKKYSDTKQRTDDLFFEFTRLLTGIQPKVFVAENVAGLVKGTAKGYFLEILAALKDCGYRVKCKVLDAQWLGVPQTRQRTIFVGVREDLGVDPEHPSPLPYRHTVRDALPWIVKAVQDPKGQFAVQEASDKPVFCIKAGSASHVYVESETDISRYAIGAEWDKLKEGEQSSKYFSCVRVDSAKPCNTIMGSSGHFPSAAQPLHPTEKRKFAIAELKRLCGFPDDFILTGSYAQQWERLGRAVPPVMMSHVAATVRDKILARL
jgi:DNA (cytosine-5)-methyltransferase 1